MTVFADSSALVKLYADEVDADLVRSHRALVVSSLARVEVPAALWRKHRTGDLSAEDAAVLAAEFTADWYQHDARFLPVAAVGLVLEEAGELVARHALRAYDAVQLASAVAARGADPGLAGFVCFDAALRAAAAKEGLQPVP